MGAVNDNELSPPPICWGIYQYPGSEYRRGWYILARKGDIVRLFKEKKYPYPKPDNLEIPKTKEFIDMWLKYWTDKLNYPNKDSR